MNIFSPTDKHAKQNIGYSADIWRQNVLKTSMHTDTLEGKIKRKEKKY